MKVIKKDGEIIEFDMNKIIKAIEKANDETQTNTDEIVEKILDELISQNVESRFVQVIKSMCSKAKHLFIKVKHLKYIVCKSRLLKLLCKFAYDILVRVISDIVKTLILTSILINKRNQSLLVMV